MADRPQDAVPAEVVQILGRSGLKGVTQLRCKVMEGNDTGKVLVRNVLGPIKKGDIVMVRETEMESSGAMGSR